MKKLKFYLAHNFDARHNARILEKYLEKEFDIEIVNPFYDLQREDLKYLDRERFDRKKYLKERILNMTECKELVLRDLWAIRNSHGIIAILHKFSLGTIFEIAYARQLGKFVIIIDESGKNYCNHPWIKVYADVILNSANELEPFFRKKLKGLNKWLIYN
jgi:nucleoside 2-deoxyribosyltransferase